MNISATVNNLTTGELIEGLQGSRICDAAVNAAKAIAARGEEALLWDDDGDVVYYGNDGVVFLNRVSIRVLGFSSSDYDKHREACGVVTA